MFGHVTIVPTRTSLNMSCCNLTSFCFNNCLSFLVTVREYLFDEIVELPMDNRPFQGSYRHIAGGAKTLGRARGRQWRP